MVCKYYKKAACPGDKTCRNASLRNTRFCPFEGSMKNKAPEACRGFVKKQTGEPHREYVPDIMHSIMAGITSAMGANTGYSRKVTVTVEGENFKAIVPIVPNDQGAGFMTQKVYCRVHGRKFSRELRDIIKKFKKGVRIC